MIISFLCRFLICWKRNSHLPVRKSFLIIKKSNLKKACEYTKNADFVQVLRVIYPYYFCNFFSLRGKTRFLSDRDRL